MSTDRPDPCPENEDSPGETEAVASGDRHAEIHFEPDPNQLVVARHLAKPQGPLAPDMQGPAQAAADADVPPVEDVAVAPEGPSVWDARPPEDAAEP
jgi:hypothetical protein